MRGNNVMRGYYNQPEATAEAFQGGWFHSGDLAVMHPDGYVELRDRKKDIIISGGENISTIEVENTIYRHPAVQEVAVVAIPDERWGEVPKAFVVPKPACSPLPRTSLPSAVSTWRVLSAPRLWSLATSPRPPLGKLKNSNSARRNGRGTRSAFTKCCARLITPPVWRGAVYNCEAHTPRLELAAYLLHTVLRRFLEKILP